MKKTLCGKSVALFLMSVMVITSIPKLSGGRTVGASDIGNVRQEMDSDAPAEEPDEQVEIFDKTVANTGLGVSKIASPKAPSDPSQEWKGSYVYFGKNDFFGSSKYRRAIKFRVLSPRTGDYSGHDTMFLDSDLVLFTKQYDTQSNNKWADSFLKEYLNGDFLDNSFTYAERVLITQSTKYGWSSYSDDYLNEHYGTKVTVDDRVFLLDIDELCNPDYGYSSDYGYSIESISWIGGNKYIDYSSHEVPNHVKKDPAASIDGKTANPVSWALRAKNVYFGDDDSIAGIRSDGMIDDYTASSSMGIAPALNLDLDNILFASCVNNSSGVGAEYKLTLKQDSMYIRVEIPKPDYAYISGKIICIPYAVSGINGSDVNRVSVLILDKEYSEGNTNDAEILYYNALSGDYSAKGSGTFSLPSGLELSGWNKDYYVYILAEDANGAQETDCSSAPLLVSKPSNTPPPSISLDKDEVKVALGDTITLKATLTGSKDKITWISSDKSVAIVDNNGKVTAKAVGVADIVASAAGKSATCTVIVKPAEPTEPAEPTAKPTQASSVSLTLDKDTDKIICGKTDTLKATLKGSGSKITWKSSDPKVAAVDSSGKITAKMAGTVTIIASAAGASAECEVTVLYKDVTSTKDFWYAPTNYLTAKNVVKGYDKQTKFKPANECTRAQMVTFIWRLQGEPEPKAKTCKFSDVKAKDYFYKACIWGNENHIVEGYKDGTFGPKIVCARKHAVTFLWRLAEKPSPKSKENKFKDVKKSDYFYTATLWASEKGILAGYKDGTFRPNGNCLRRQMVTFLYKYDKFVNGKG